MIKANEEWNNATPQDIPHATYWPVIVALGLSCMFWGILTVYYISIAGFLLFFVGVGGWINDLREELNVNSKEKPTDGS